MCVYECVFVHFYGMSLCKLLKKKFVGIFAFSWTKFSMLLLIRKKLLWKPQQQKNHDDINQVFNIRNYFYFQLLLAKNEQAFNESKKKYKWWMNGRLSSCGFPRSLLHSFMLKTCWVHQSYKLLLLFNRFDDDDCVSNYLL